MNCGEVQNLAPLYLSGEMQDEERSRFAAHLAACPGCAREIEQQAELDARLAAALEQDSPDSAPVERRVRLHIATARSRRRWMAAGAIAASLAVFGAGIAWWRQAAVPGVYAAAARDHRVEVIAGEQRRWRSGAEAIDGLAAPYGLSFTQVASLGRSGYALERAKICGLNGERMLHAVFTNGRDRYSVYLRPNAAALAPPRLVTQEGEHVAGIETGRFRALVVTAHSAAECEESARLVASRL